MRGPHTSCVPGKSNEDGKLNEDGQGFLYKVTQVQAFYTTNGHQVREIRLSESLCESEYSGRILLCCVPTSSPFFTSFHFSFFFFGFIPY